MKKILMLFAVAIAMFAFSACSDDDENGRVLENPEMLANPETPSDSSKILVAYFSWSGNTEIIAKRIAELTCGTLYEILPDTAYTTDYQTLAYTVARNELNTNARPTLKDSTADFSGCDYVFIGCPVWWGTAPMIISTFCETYNFSGKTIIPFCTYASTGREATIQKINLLTPNSTHLSGFGVSGSSTNGVESWLRKINMIK